MASACVGLLVLLTANVMRDGLGCSVTCQLAEITVMLVVHVSRATVSVPMVGLEKLARPDDVLMIALVLVTVSKASVSVPKVFTASTVQRSMKCPRTSLCT
jgi:hypothetical protein